MGSAITEHLIGQQITVVAYNRTPKETTFPTEKTIPELLTKLPAPRIIFLMVVPQAVDEVIAQLSLSEGDILIDGANSFYKDSLRRAEELKTKGILFIDCGTSGGIEGARNGSCLMLGGDEQTVMKLTWLWDALAVKDGWAYIGPSGAGHFVKMVHNGIEYGEVQALGEGIEIIAKSPYHVDLAKTVALWNHGSIIRGYLVELLSRILEKDPELTGVIGKIGDLGTGGWALAAAREFGVEAPVLEQSLAARQKSQTVHTISSKVVSALRKEYGGHEEAKT
jgi:6-phosphogluconate dehydrogenase